MAKCKIWPDSQVHPMFRKHSVFPSDSDTEEEV